MMNEQRLKEMVAKCRKEAAVADAKAFLLVGIDREAAGMGSGGALVRKGEDGGWKVRLLNMRGREAADRGYGEIVVGDEDLYDDDPGGLDGADEKEERADCWIWYSGYGASVRFFAHANRTDDGIHIIEDFVTLDRGDGPKEIPIVYWNTGSEPVKADGHPIPPDGRRVSSPADFARTKRRELKQEQDRCMAAQIGRASEEQAQAELQAVQEQIMEWEPGWTEAQARRAAEMFLEQERRV